MNDAFRYGVEDITHSFPGGDSSRVYSYGGCMDVAVRCPRVEYGYWQYYALANVSQRDGSL